MTRYRHLIAVGLLVLCLCAMAPAVAQTLADETQPAFASQGEDAAALSDRVSRVEGRVEGMEQVSTRAATASEEASKSAQSVIRWVGWCTSVVSAIVFLVGALLVIAGLGERKNIEAIRQRAEEAVEKGDEAVKQASKCAAAAEQALKSVQAVEERIGQLLASAEKGERAIGHHVEQANAHMAELAAHRQDAETKEDPDKQVSAEERRAEDMATHARTLFRKREYERAVSEFDRALAITPANAQWHALRGLGLSVLDRQHEALVAFDRAIGLRSGYAGARYQRACVQARLDNKDEALQDLKKAIELEAKNRERARTDDDFATLHDDPDFRKLVGLGEEGGEGA